MNDKLCFRLKYNDAKYIQYLMNVKHDANTSSDAIRFALELSSNLIRLIRRTNGTLAILHDGKIEQFRIFGLDDWDIDSETDIPPAVAKKQKVV